MGFFDKLFGKKGNSKQSESQRTEVDTNQQVDPGYRDKIIATKESYPFQHWREGYDQGLTQYTKENCGRIKNVFDNLITSLIDIGEKAREEEKRMLFKTAILETNHLNNEIDGLIETGEREDLCDLTDSISIACGLDPAKYGDGEGLASEWREW